MTTGQQVSTEAPATEAGTLERLVDFCLGPGQRVFAGWDRTILRVWLCWHAEHHGLVYLTNERGRVVGLGAGRRCWLKDVQKHWHGDAAGDVFVFEKVVATRPGALGQLVRAWQERYPEWRGLRLFRHRCGDKYVELGPKWLARLAQ